MVEEEEEEDTGWWRRRLSLLFGFLESMCCNKVESQHLRRVSFQPVEAQGLSVAPPPSWPALAAGGQDCCCCFFYLLLVFLRGMN